MADTVANLLANGISPVTIGGLGTAVKYFPPAPGASIGVAGAGYGFVFCPGSSRMNGQTFTMRATGNFSTGGDASSPAVTVGLYASKNLQSNVNPNYQTAQAAVKPALVISTLASAQQTAAALIGGFSPWNLTATLNADTQSGILQGNYVIQIDNGALQSGVITSLSGVDMSQPTPLGFLIGITFSITGSANTANMFQFSLIS